MASLRAARNVSNLQVETIRFSRNAIPVGSTGSVFTLDDNGYMSLSSEIHASSLTIVGNLVVDGGATFHGPIVANTITAKGITVDDLDVKQFMDVSGAVIKHLTITDSLVLPPEVIIPFGATVFQAMHIYAGTTTAEGGSEYLSYALDVSGTALFRHGITAWENVAVLGGVSVKDNLKVDGSAVVDGSFIISGGISADGGISVSGGVTMNGGLAISGGATLDSLFVSGDAIIVGGATMSSITAAGTSLVINGRISNTYMRTRIVNPVAIQAPPTGRIESSQTFHTDYIGYRGSFIMGQGFTAYSDGTSTEGIVLAVAGGHPSIINVGNGSAANSLVFDGTNKRIGVFNTTPAVEVDIVGKVQVLGDALILGNLVTSGVTIDSLSITGGAVIAGGLTANSIVSTGGITASGTISASGITANFANITSSMSVGGALGVVGTLTAGMANVAGDLGVDGRVGIGKIVPSQALDVSGNTNITGNLNVLGTISTASLLSGINVLNETVSWSDSGPVSGAGYYVKIGTLLIRWFDSGAANVDGGSPITWTGPNFADSNIFCSATGNVPGLAYNITSTSVSSVVLNKDASAIRMLLIGKTAP